MKVFDTASLTPDYADNATNLLHIYNGLDCAITYEIYEKLIAEADETTLKTYDFSKALQGPILEMNLRGVLVDRAAIAEALTSFQADVTRLTTQLNTIITEGVGAPALNPNSPAQLKELFYGTLGLKPIRTRDKTTGLMKDTLNRDAMEKLQSYFYAKPLIAHILKIRDFSKKIGFLKTGISSDGRIRTAFNIAGTVTGRLASSSNEFSEGSNLQNIDRRLRKVFIPDPGYKFCNVDLEQGDSRNVGAIHLALFNDSTYLNACESGDLHTTVAKLVWTNLPWPGDPKGDRKIADQIFYRDLSYRDLAKRLGHGTNYLGTPATMAMHTKVAVAIIKQFQYDYFRAFPAMKKWHDEVARVLLAEGKLTTLFGRRRWFFGRRDEPQTLREAVAYCPQSMTADQINTALLKIWRSNIAQPLLQVHDSLLFQYPEHAEAEVIPQILEQLKVPITLPSGRVFVVPGEAKVGWNWADSAADNPQGLMKWRGTDARTRVIY